MIKSSAAYLSAVVGKSRQTGLKAVISIIDPDIQYGTASSSSAAPWTNSEGFYQKPDAVERYATLERGRWLLDGSFDIFPENFKAETVYTMDELSGDDGTFESEQ